MDDAIKLFAVMMAILVPVALGGGLYLLIASFVKRTTRTHDAIESGDLQELRGRLEELEGKESRLQELEERLDFLERALPRAREAKAPRDKTPV